MKKTRVLNKKKKISQNHFNQELNEWKFDNIILGMYICQMPQRYDFSIFICLDCVSHIERYHMQSVKCV